MTHEILWHKINLTCFIPNYVCHSKSNNTRSYNLSLKIKHQVILNKVPRYRDCILTSHVTDMIKNLSTTHDKWHVHNVPSATRSLTERAIRLNVTGHSSPTSDHWSLLTLSATLLSSVFLFLFFFLGERAGGDGGVVKVRECIIRNYE